MSARTDMKRSVPTESASASIDERIKELGDWRGKMLAKVRDLIHKADPEIVEELKWAKAKSPGTPVFSHGGIVCTRDLQECRQADICQGSCLERPCRPLQLQPRGEREARH